jgi:hypothetical protein
MRTRTQCLIGLTLLGILGIGPVPTSTLVLFYVVLVRPPWFKDLVLKLYAEDRESEPSEK